MISEETVTVAGSSEDVFLFYESPDFGDESAFKIRHRLKTIIAKSLSDRESRWPRWGCVRTEVEYQWPLDGGDAATLRTALATLATKRVLVPLWLDYRLQSDYANRIYDAQYWLRTDTNAIVAVGSIGSVPSTTWIVPLILARLERPSGEVEDYTVGIYSIEFRERSPWDWRCDIRDKSLNADAFPTIDPAWTKVVDLSKDRLEYRQLGESREDVVQGDEAPASWGQEAEFTLDGEDGSDFLSFWRYGAQGRYHAFTMDAWFRPHTVATSDTPFGYMARYADDELEIEVIDVGLYRTTPRFWELPWESSPPAGEEFECSREVYLYEFAQVVPVGGPVYTRYTDGEADLTADSKSWAAAPVEAGDIEEEMGEDGSSLSVEIADGDDNPLRSWYRRQGEGYLELTIYRTDPDDPSTVTEIFSGRLGNVSLDRNVYAGDFGRNEGFQVPRVLMQRMDNHGMFSPESGIDKSAYVRTGTVEAIWYDGHQIYVDFDDAGGLPGANNFNGGWIEKGSGSTYESRFIMWHGEQTHPAPTKDVTLNLDRPFNDLSMSDSVRIYPGYAGTWDDAQSRYSSGNKHYEFLGFPYLPVTSPSTDNSVQPTSTPGKK